MRMATFTKAILSMGYAKEVGRTCGRMAVSIMGISSRGIGMDMGFGTIGTGTKLIRDTICWIRSMGMACIRGAMGIRIRVVTLRMRGMAMAS
jgi:hypothetical protein